MNSTSELKNYIREVGRHKEDKRLQRRVRELIGVQLTIEGSDWTTRKNAPRIKEKYLSDWKHMFPTFRSCVDNAIQDSNSRRLIILNTTKFNTIFQCFNLIQFVKDVENYAMFVYQRSVDMEKIEDDINFFSYVAKKFEKATGFIVGNVTIFYGSAHENY